MSEPAFTRCEHCDRGRGCPHPALWILSSTYTKPHPICQSCRTNWHALYDNNPNATFTPIQQPQAKKEPMTSREHALAKALLAAIQEIHTHNSDHHHLTDSPTILRWFSLPVTCPTCEGSGITHWPAEDGGSPPLICPTCDSKGHLPLSHAQATL